MKTAVFLLLEYLGINAMFRWLNRGKIKVLLYHSTAPRFPLGAIWMPPGHFRRQLKHLCRHYNPVALTTLGEWKGLRADRVNVLLTFDDGFIDNYTLATTELKPRGINAVFFLIAECCESGCVPSYVVARRPELEHDLAIRTIPADKARQMLAEGFVFGSHSLAHQDFSNIAADVADTDGHASQQLLESQLGGEVKLFAFPWGKYLPEQMAPLLCRYRRLFTTEHGFNLPDDRVIRRNEIAGYYQMCAAASGSLDFLRILCLPGRRLESAASI